MLLWTFASTNLSDASLIIDLKEETDRSMETYPMHTTYLDYKLNIPLMNSFMVENFILHWYPKYFQLV